MSRHYNSTSHSPIVVGKDGDGSYELEIERSNPHFDLYEHGDEDIAKLASRRTPTRYPFSGARNAGDSDNAIHLPNTRLFDWSEARSAPQYAHQLESKRAPTRHPLGLVRKDDSSDKSDEEIALPNLEWGEQSKSITSPDLTQPTSRSAPRCPSPTTVKKDDSGIYMNMVQLNYDNTKPSPVVVEVPSNYSKAQTPVRKEESSRDIREWQRQWKIIMHGSHIFFDGVDDASIEKVKPSLTKISSTIEMFFGSTVSHIVTRRAVDAEYPPTDVLYKAKQLSIKIWSYEKLVRFLTNLLGHSPKAAHSLAGSAHLHASKLSHMLREEKLVGSYDRDPLARRDDYHYFKGPYILVWDPTHHYRPFMMKEYAKTEDHMDGEWPRFHSSSSHRSPFVPDPSRGTERVALGKRHSPDEDNSASKAITKDQQHPGRENMVPAVKPVTPMAMYQPSCSATPATPKFAIRSRSKEIVASGVQSVTRSNVDSGITYLGGGNGLNPVLAQVPSREIKKLKRQVPTKIEQQPMAYPERTEQQLVCDKPTHEPKSGFCENCHEQYDDFTAHIQSKKHMRFAHNNSHFAKLDLFISCLQRKPKHEKSIYTINTA